MPDRTNKFIPRRSFVLIAVCAAISLVLAIRLFNLQVICYEEYQNRVLDNVQAEVTVKADRGEIYDRNGVLLATNYTVYRVFISPRDIKNDAQKELICRGLSDILHVTYEKVLENANMTTKADRTIKRNVEEEVADQVLAFIKENDLDRQVYLEASSKRYYPYGSLAAQVIGFCGTDGGLLGLELQYNEYLTGVDGKYITAKDGRSQRMTTKYETYVEATDGARIETTIDVELQAMLENQLEQTYVESIAQNRVTGVVLDPNTGAVLAMATYPSFDLNDPYTLNEYSQVLLDALQLDPSTEEYNQEYTKLLYQQWRNKAVSDLYEPGSTFKPITVSMALENNVTKFTDVYRCPGHYTVSGQIIHCHKLYGHGTNPLSYMLQQSCNPTLMQVAEKIGKETFYQYFTAFGYTEKTGIDLPGESSPIYYAYSDFTNLSLACYSFGQHFKVTALQQITALSCIANGGNLMTPYLVERIVANDGTVLYEHDSTPKRQVISSNVCAEVATVLEDGVSGNGGARNTYVAGYRIAAKTGTSEVCDILNEEGKAYLRVGSTAAFAPFDNPVVASIIVVDQPLCENIYGSYVAAPYVASFLSGALPYMGVEINYTEADLARISTTLRNYVGLPLNDVAADLTNRGISYTVQGDGDTVTYQAPLGGSSFNRQTGRVTLYTGTAVPTKTVPVPNVVGKNATLANQAIINAGLNIAFEGVTSSNDAVVISQSPAAGETVEYGTVITVKMRHLADGDDVSLGVEE